MIETTVPDGHTLVNTNQYRRFLPKVTTTEHIVKTDIKDMWDRQIAKEHQKEIKQNTPKKTKQQKRPNYYKKKKKNVSHEDYQERLKKRYHQRHWKNMDYGDVTKAGPVTTTKREAKD